METPQSSPTTCPWPETSLVLRSPLAITDYKKAAELAIGWARHGDSPRAVAAANTHLVTLARHDEAFAGALKQFDVLLPDGMPLVWCMNKFSAAGMKDRVYGPTFMLRCLEMAGNEFSHFLLGGSEELLETLQRKLREKFPGIRIAGAYSPPFGTWTDEEDRKIIDLIAKSGAQFTWIGLGCPKQEYWVAKNKNRLPGGVYSAVGAAFAFHAGMVKQAPGWMQRSGLEWLFRIMAEPRRLWKRYVVYNSLFIFYLLKDFKKQGARGR